jgi:SAGA-associated factor 73
LLTLYFGILDDKKSRATGSPSTNSIASPGPVVNQLDDNARGSFATGRPLEDSPDLSVCKLCKKSFLKSAIKAHTNTCLADRKEAIRKKKEMKEGKEKAKKKEEGEKDKVVEDKKKDVQKVKLKKDKEKEKEKEKEKLDVDEDGDSKMVDDDEEDAEAEDAPEAPQKKPPGGLKSAKKSAGKKTDADGDKKGKKRKADGDAEKGPKQKKKKEEPKPKAPKPKGTLSIESSRVHC